MPARLPPDGHSLAIGRIHAAAGWVLPATGWLYTAARQEVGMVKLVVQC